MAKAGGKGSATAEDPRALGIGNDASELERASRVWLSEASARQPGRDHWDAKQVSRLWQPRLPVSDSATPATVATVAAAPVRTGARI